MDHPLHAFLARHAAVRFVRFQWLDLSGILRARIVTKSYTLQLIARHQFLSVATAMMLLPVSNPQVAKLPPTGCADLRPDWSSLRLCLFAPMHASVMCHFCMPALDDPFALCPRSALDRVLSHAVSSANSLRLGLEVEFVVLPPDRDTSCHPDSITSNSATSGLRSNSVLAALEETVAMLEESGVAVQDFHAEGPLQLEIATGPLAPLEAVDALIYTQETVRSVFARHGLVATMAPDAAPSAAKSGLHIHISLGDADQEDSFLSGMLDNTLSIAALGLASMDSFVRVQDLMNATGAWVSWGLQHRDVPIRKVARGHWEIRCVDATANPYLVVALIIAAGLEGITSKRPLTMVGLSDFATNYPRPQLEEAGVKDKLPSTMNAAITIAHASPIVNATFGKALSEAYLSVKRVDLEAMHDMDSETRRRLFSAVF
ncbi:glutamine synthetase/guanido kinase [Polyplosphaeria fusca]|uniref:Glutamine synthetase n=1 Tax=Polyplosphaeria fusca TaxID=682080 RepID=A0A9P4R9X0_9PLEO|nr:glutamine synthetase/guanido kinase [Polyplosphaeria fusca]